MKPWHKSDCLECDNMEIEIVPALRNDTNTSLPKIFFEVKRKCKKHGSNPYWREIKREKPKLTLV